MKFSDVKRLPILMPSRSEQVIISDFLDRETAKIDALVHEQEKIIQLLDEKRQAVISHAVTKGLDPAVPVNPSGVDWLGDIPAHWSVRQARHLISKFEQGWSPECDSRPAEGSEWGVLKAGCVNGGVYRDEENKALPANLAPDPTLEVRPGDIIMSRANGSPDLIGSVARVRSTRGQLMLSDKLFRLICKDDVLPDFVVWLFASHALRCQIVNAISGADGMANNLPQSEIKAFRVCVPPLEEQKQIVEYVQAQSRNFEKLIAAAKRAVSLLQERRMILVEAAVTGKIDVRAIGALSQSVFDSQQARLLVGAAIVEAIANKPSSGRTKTHKIVYLTEVHAGVRELAGVYQREAAGPLDPRLIEDMEGQFQKIGHVSVEQPGGHGRQVTYRVCGRPDRFGSQLDRALGARAKVMRKLIADLGELDTKSVEAVATLYAVWNDVLLDGQSPSDNAIVAGVLDDWHPEKRQKFTAQQLHIWLGWMRRHAVVPEGREPKTTRGRLFA